MKQLLKSLAFLSILSLLACNNDEKMSTDDTERAENRKALRIISTNCFSCHSPDREITEQSRLAPQLYKIREVYMKNSKTKQQFTQQMTDYLKFPTIEKAMMKDDIERYGLMPRTQLTTNDIRLITNYIYENEMTAEQWSKAGKMSNSTSE